MYLQQNLVLDVTSIIYLGGWGEGLNDLAYDLVNF